MMKRYQMLSNISLVPLCLILTFSGANIALAERVKVTLLQLNDLYEITPVNNGKSGGLARVATLRKSLLRRNPNTITLLAGDFLSPSALGTAKVNGEALAGQQTIAVLNQMGLDLATFGNHEFDLKEPQLLQRLQASKFTWISSNVTQTSGQAFPGVGKSKIFTLRGKTGTAVRVGFFGLTLASNPAPYVKYEDYLAAAKREILALRPQVDILVALTHLSIEQDRQLADTYPEIDLILGGHEHDNIQQWRGADFTPIFKADANARSVYIHHLNFDTDTRRLMIDTRLTPITDRLPADPQTAKVVDTWVKRGFEAFRQNGFQPEQIVVNFPEALDGLESSVRNRSTRLTELIAQGMLKAVGGADLSLFNGGSIRIDDVLPPGAITQYDVIRILPFGGKVLKVEIEGKLLKQVLDRGVQNRGTGGYLQSWHLKCDDINQTWLIQGQPLQLDRRYQVAINDFLVSGKEKGLDFLNLQHPSVKMLSEHGDVRFALIKQLQAIK
jgi:5'-nucleotidase